MQKNTRLGSYKTLALATSMSLVGGAGLIAATAPSASAQENAACTPVHVIQVVGTGAGKTTDSTEPKAFAPNYNPTELLQQKVGADKVSGYNTPYPASVGNISMFWSLANPGGYDGGTEQFSYGNSVKYGVDKATKHMADYKARCGNAKFQITGYSQGASVAGDIAAAVANGRVPGVTSDDVANVVLIADPGRSSASAYDSYSGDKSVLYAPIPPGKMQKNFEIVNDGGSGQKTDRIGWTGERPARFKGMYGKVLSLCDAGDIACSAEPNSLARGLANYANSESTAASLDTDAAQRISKAVQYAHSQGIIQAATSGDINKVNEILATAMAKANFGVQDIPEMLSVAKEIGDVFNVIMDPKYCVAETFDFGEVLTSLITTALPKFIESNVSAKQLLGYAKQFGLLNALPPEARFAIEAAAKLPFADVLIQKIVGFIPGIFTKIAKALGAPVAKDTGTVGQQLAQMMSLGTNHGRYWNDSLNSINGKASALYAIDWMAQGVNGVVSGKSTVASPQGKALNNPTEETGIEKAVNGKQCAPTAPGGENNNNGGSTTQKPKPTEGAKPTEGTEPTNEPKPTEGTKPTNGAKPTDGSKPTDGAKPTEGTKPTEGETEPTEGNNGGSTTEPTEGNNGGNNTAPGTNPGKGSTQDPNAGKTEDNPRVVGPGKDGSWDPHAESTEPVADVRPGDTVVVHGPKDVEPGTTFEGGEGIPSWAKVDPKTGEITLTPGADVPEGVTMIPVKIINPDGSVEYVNVPVNVTKDAKPSVDDSNNPKKHTLAQTGANTAVLGALAAFLAVVGGMFALRRRKA